jgi:tRNA threonylcarbamoyladenosine biosynthesis protein TsaB
MKDAEALVEITTTSDQTHSKRLLPMIDMALSAGGIGLREIDGFAVTIGPGSFTGLRIGVSTVKGLAWAVGKPVAGVSTLEALACQAGKAVDLICALLDARKGEVYAALFLAGGEAPVISMQATVLPPAALRDRIAERCLFVGDGALAYRREILDMFGDRAVFAPDGQHKVRAATVGALAYRRFRAERFDAALFLVPNYIRRSDAELASAGPRKAAPPAFR